MERSTQHAFDAEEVMAYLDGELEAQRATALAAHLEHCAACQEVAQGFRAVSERMMSFEIEPVPTSVSDGVLARLNASEVPKKTPTENKYINTPAWRRWTARPLAWGSACVLIAALLLAVGVSQLHRERGSAVASKSWLNQDASHSLLFEDTRSAGKAGGGGGGYSATESVPPAPPPPASEGDELKAPESVGPMIVQTAELNIVATNYDEASAMIEKLAAAHGGYVEKLDATAQTGSARGLSVTLRIPAKQVDGFLADARKLGHVEKESRSNEEVSDQFVDLQARLRSARAAEQRLIELLGMRTGKLSDVLEAERELARIRGEIESMQGQSTVLVHKVSYATVQVELSEEYRQVLGSVSPSTGTKIWNALVEGFSNLEAGAVALLIFLLSYGPSMLFWLTLVVVPSWFAWRRFTRRAQG
jgi:Domain of unknown function (DUF4349)/Putative zinc-finger